MTEYFHTVVLIHLLKGSEVWRPLLDSGLVWTRSKKETDGLPQVMSSESVYGAEDYKFEKWKNK